jgi:hypothetical protein
LAGFTVFTNTNSRCRLRVKTGSKAYFQDRIQGPSSDSIAIRKKCQV